MLVGKSVFFVIFLVVLCVGSLEKTAADEGSHTVRVRNRARTQAGRVGQVPGDRSLRLTAQFRNGSSGGAVNIIQAKVVEGMDIKVVASRVHGSD